MTKAKRFPKSRVMELLRISFGNLSATARALGCSRSDLVEAIAASPELQAAVQEARETLVDVAEARLLDLVRKGDVTATAFYLKTKGRNRGWCERWEEEQLRQHLDEVEKAIRLRS